MLYWFHSLIPWTPLCNLICPHPPVFWVSSPDFQSQFSLHKIPRSFWFECILIKLCFRAWSYVCKVFIISLALIVKNGILYFGIVLVWVLMFVTERVLKLFNVVSCMVFLTHCAKWDRKCLKLRIKCLIK